MTKDDGEMRMRREIGTFTDADLVKELAGRGRLKTVAIERQMSPEAVALGEHYAIHVERLMASDLGRFLAEHGATSVVRSAEHIRMTATVLVEDPTPSENTDGR